MDLTQIYDNVIGASEEERKRKNIFDIDDVTNYSNNNAVVDVVKQDLSRQWSVPRKEAEKYEKFGVYYNPRDAADGSLDVQLADAQSNWSKFGNALAQTIVSELALGIPLAISDLFDAVGQAVGISDHNYQNPVSRKLEEWQEAFNNDVAPIYSRPGSGFGSGTDFGWWMQNIPSIASSLTLLIPAAGGTKLVSMAGKGLGKLGKNAATSAAKTARVAGKSKKAERWVNRARRLESGNLFNLSSRNFERAKLLAENGMTAALSRTMENYQEARQVYNDMYADVASSLNNMSDEQYADFLNKNQNIIADVDVTNKDEVAKAVARKSADMTFKADYANTIFDVIELYALRNIGFSGFRNSKVSAAARRLDKNAKRFAGKYSTLAELDELVAKQSLGKKAANKIGDFLYTGRTVFAAEASEGVEEAINYIAQQEGMHVGKTMLGMEANSTFSNRLQQYVKNPELWESAFWGVAGGIVFQGAGSGLARAKTAIERKNEAKNKKPNEKTGEDVNAKTNWKALWEQGDVKRVKTSIENRLAIENKYKEDVEQIKQGNNPYIKGEKLESEEEREHYLQKARNARRTAMVLNAMDSGTIDMLESYMQDDNVKQALIDKGLVSKEDADAIQQEDIEAIKRLQKMYDKNLRLVDTASRNLSIDKGVNIPLEYLQIIARNNIEAQLQVEDYEEQLNHWEAEANDLAQTFRDKLDPSINHKEIIRLNWLTRKLGELEAEKREINKDKAIASSISGQERLRQLDKNINTIRQMVAEINPDNKLANLLFAIENSFAYEKTKDGSYEAIGISKDYLDFRKAVVDKNYDYFKKLDDRLVDIQENDFGAQKVLDDNVRRSLSSKVTSSISNVSKELGTAYATLADLQYRIAEERSNINLTESEIEQEAKSLHNYMNEVRKNKIENSVVTIQDLADKYGADEIRKLVTQRYNGQELDYSNLNITEEDKERFSDALDTINLDESLNKDVYRTIDTILLMHDDIKAAQKAAKDKATVENSSVSQKPISDNLNQQTTNQSTKQQNSSNGQNSGQNGQNTNQNQQQNGSNINAQSGLNVSNISDEVNITNDGNYTFKATDNPDNFEVEFIDSSINDKHFSNENLFDQEKGVSIIDENFIIGRKPIIDKNGNVIKKGLLVLDNDENAAIVAQEEDNSNQGGQSPIPSTGEVNSFSNPINPEVASQPQQSTDTISDDEVFKGSYDENDIISKANDAVFTEIRTAREKGSTIDWNDLESRMNSELQKEGEHSDYIAEQITRAINKGKKIAERKGIKQVDAVLDAVIRSSAITEMIPKDSPLRKEFSNAVINLLKVFNEDVGYDVIDGKQYINVESLCRYCDKVLDDKVSARRLSANLVNLVKENTDIIYTDGNIDRVTEKLNDSSEFKPQQIDYLGIDYNSILIGLIKERKTDELEKLYNVVDKIQPGDKITVERSGKGFYFSINGVRIGSLPDPQPYKNGGLYQINEGWRTDVLNHNGTINSDLRDLFIRWATETSNPDIKALNDIILKFAYRDQTKVDVGKLIKEFENNKEIKEARAKGFLVGDSEKALEGISKIWKFTRDNAYIGTLSKEELDEARTTDINQWFENRVYPSFKFIEYLRYNPNAIVEINSISEGKQIEDKPMPISKAIGSNHKGKVKLGVMETSGIITLAGNGIDGSNTINWGSGKRGNTFIVIPARNGVHAYVHAYPQKVNATDISKDAKEIKNAIYEEIDRICNGEYISPKEQIQALEDFLRTILPNYVGNSLRNNGIFTYQNRAVLVVRDNTLKDRITKNGFSLEFKPVDAQGGATYINVTPGVNISEVANQIKNAIETCAAFNISFSGVNNDKNNKGDFVIRIPNHEPFVFSSYNDFIINNNLILVTTHPTKDGKSNFERATDDFRTTQQITVRINEDSSTPVESNEAEQSTPEIAPVPESNAITSIFSNNRIKNKSVRLAELILGKNIVKEITFGGKKFAMFPKNIIFVDENIGDNATTNIGIKNAIHPNNPNVIVPPKSVVIGREWLAMATSENEDERKEAIKKLIHEQLHLIIHDGNTNYIEQIREIFDEFAAKNTNEALTKYLYKWDEGRYYTDGKLNEEGLEEFLVESLTSNELAEGLNAIDSNDTTTTSKKKSLFQKIMEVITKMLGLDIREGSLYAKEFKLLRDVLSTPSQMEINFEEENINTITDTEEVDLSLNEEDFDFFSSIIQEESYDKSYTNEMKSIRDKAIADGTFMKAPNDNPTNLTERQWLQVRTKAFKKWFGDWLTYAKIKNARVIWGHPGTGKTWMFKNDNAGIIDFDSEYKVKLNKQLGLPEDAGAKEIRKAFRKENPQVYKDTINALFDEALAEAKRTGKQLLVSDLHLLTDRINDIDVITNISDKEFIERSHERGEHDEDNKMLWKNSINEALKTVPSEKIVNTTGRISDLIRGANVSKVVDENGEPLVVYRGEEEEHNIKRNIGFYTTDRNYADSFQPYDFVDGRYIPKGHLGAYFLNIRNLKFLPEGIEFYTIDEQIENDRLTLEKNPNYNIPDGYYGHDAPGKAEGPSEGMEYVTTNSNQVKSVTDNNGEFSRENNDTRRSSIRETYFPSTIAFVDNFPISQQATMVEKIDNGEFDIRCK